MRAFRSALEVGREQGAALFALRAAIALARQSEGRRGPEDGRRVLLAARQAFPSGEPVDEVREADALL